MRTFILCVSIFLSVLAHAEILSKEKIEILCTDTVFAEKFFVNYSQKLEAIQKSGKEHDSTFQKKIQVIHERGIRSGLWLDQNEAVRHLQEITKSDEIQAIELKRKEAVKRLKAMHMGFLTSDILAGPDIVKRNEYACNCGMNALQSMEQSYAFAQEAWSITIDKTLLFGKSKGVEIDERM